MIAKRLLLALTTWFTGSRLVLTAMCTLCGFAPGFVQSATANVRINEFMADNEGGLRTQAGAAADWIELVNDDSVVVDLSGWYLTDRAATPTKWRFPDGTTIPGNGYLIIFADSSTNSVTNNELHANFGLSKDGEYLGLIQSNGVTVVDEFAPSYPPQLTDVSYGRASHEEELVGVGAPARYRIPNALGDASWIDAKGALGFSAARGSFTVRYYEMREAINDIDGAEFMVADSAYWNTDRAYPIVGPYDTLDFHANSASGFFGNNLLFPGHSYIGEDRDRFVVVSEGSIYVPSAGEWTFGVGSDDGFRLRITGHDVNFVSEFTTGRGFGVTLATFNFPTAGVYDLNLIYYENGGGASLEFSVAQGFQSAFSLESFHLTGDPEGGILHAGAIGTFVETDVGAVMQTINARLDAEYAFTLDEVPPAEDRFLLSVRCADGFSATLNGAPIAALNAPTPLAWNSAATITRSVEEAIHWVSYFVPSSLLISGSNTLAITALNNSAGDAEFLIQPRFTVLSAKSFPFFFKTPTPGLANSRGYTAPTPKVISSEPRGYRTVPFTVSLASETGPAEVRYTLDGSVPTTNSPIFAGPLNITTTTTLRTAVVDPESVRQSVTTVTWLFLEDVIKQGSTPPAGWPTDREVNNHVMEYGLRQAVVISDAVRLRNGMTNAIPTLSLVTDLAHLFSPQTGIYVNPGNDGTAWERPVSVELIDPLQGRTAEFHIDAGLRIRGAYSRSTGNPKHSFRLFFRSDYGESKLRFPLFGDEGASEFDKVDLRTSQNYSWAFENSDQDTFIRETFSRDSQRDMGKPYTRSRYYHLYLNGQYWGLYQTQERGDADYAETYLGGSNDDWDCIKTTQPGYTTTASDGTLDAFYALHNLAVNQGFTGAFSANYQRVKGLNPDGTPNPNYPVYLDEDNLIIYMLIAYYTGDPDSPVSVWGGMPNNMYGLYNRAIPGGFQWLRHDAEHSLGAHSGFPVTCDTTMAGATFTGQQEFNPAILHHRLCLHPEYRRRFADLVQQHLFGDGALTPVKAQQRFRSRMDEIDLAIIGESARWGRGKTRDATWLPTCNSVLNTYLAQRRDILVAQFRARGWYPSITAPDYSVMNTTVPSGQLLRISALGTFYYTIDGADPCLPNGAINPSAIAVTSDTNSTGPRTLIQRGAEWRYFDSGSEPPALGSVTWKDPGFADTTWAHGPATLGFAGSATINPVVTPTRRYVNGVSGTQVTTTYFRHTFTLASTNGNPNLLIDILRDDGAVVFLNGVPILAENMNGFDNSYDTYSADVAGSPDQNTYFTRTVAAAHLLRIGANTVAVELHQSNAGSSDLYFDCSFTLPAGSTSVFTDLMVSNTLRLKARAYTNGEWSPLAENLLTVDLPPVDYSPLRVSELMYAPPSPAAGSPFSNDDFAWIELRNSGTNALELDRVRFAAGITHTFTPFSLPAGERLVLAKNPEAFALRHPTNGVFLVAWDSGNLARGGETLSLVNPLGTNILTFTYSKLWYPETFNTGRSLVAVDLAAPEPIWSTVENWRASQTATGTPGLPEPPAFTNPRMNAGLLQLTALGLEKPVELRFSADLKVWSLCDPSAWSQTGAVFTIDLHHPSFPSGERCFFQLRVTD
jgi:hypothetical protein